MIKGLPFWPKRDDEKAAAEISRIGLLDARLREAIRNEEPIVTLGQLIRRIEGAAKYQTETLSQIIEHAITEIDISYEQKKHLKDLDEDFDNAKNVPKRQRKKWGAFEDATGSVDYVAEYEMRGLKERLEEMFVLAQQLERGRTDVSTRNKIAPVILNLLNYMKRKRLSASDEDYADLLAEALKQI